MTLILTEKQEPICKRMNDINSFQTCDGEIYLRGKDEHGEDFIITYDAYDFLNWIDQEQIKYIKKQLNDNGRTKGTN